VPEHVEVADAAHHLRCRPHREVVHPCGRGPRCSSRGVSFVRRVTDEICDILSGG
jgi:hypothetical protein